MPVQTIECHIATVLMKRFLDGEKLPPNVLGEMESHVKACPSCQEILKGEKLSIEEVLDGDGASTGFLNGLMKKMGGNSSTAGGFATAYPAEALVAASRSSYRTAAPGISAFKNPKVLVLSIGLAVVLILMSTILKDPTALMGGRAIKSVAPSADEGLDSKGGSETGDDSGHADGEATDHAEGVAEGEPSTADGAGDEVAGGDAHGEAVDSHGEGNSHEAEPETASASAGHSTTSHEPDATDHQPAGTVKVGNREDYSAPDKPVSKPQGTDLIIVGGSGTKTVTSNGGGSQTATSTTKSPAKVATSGGGSKPKTTPKRSGSRSSSSKKKASGGGIRVYDKNGKVIN